MSHRSPSPASVLHPVGRFAARRLHHLIVNSAPGARVPPVPPAAAPPPPKSLRAESRQWHRGPRVDPPVPPLRFAIIPTLHSLRAHNPGMSPRKTTGARENMRMINARRSPAGGVNVGFRSSWVRKEATDAHRGGVSADRDRCRRRRGARLRPAGRGTRVPPRARLRSCPGRRSGGAPQLAGALRPGDHVPRALCPVRLRRRYHLAGAGHRHHHPAPAADRPGGQAGRRGGPAQPRPVPPGHRPGLERGRVRGARPGLLHPRPAGRGAGGVCCAGCGPSGR